MSFVRDDHSYTRGVGAVDAMDRVSSRRRRAAARGAKRMARKDAIMSRHTLGRISQIDTGGGGGTSVPPPPPRPPTPLPPKPVPPKIPIKISIRDIAALAPRRDLTIGVKPDLKTVIVDPVRPGIKFPGAQVAEIMPTTTAPPKEQVLPPPKPVITIVASPGSPVAGGGKPAPSSGGGGGFPGFAPEPELDLTVSEQPVATTPAKKPNNKLLMYAAIGIGAYWLLTRKG